MNWLQWFNWITSVLIMAAAGLTIYNLRRQNRMTKQLQLLWAEEAPPVPPVEIVLKTGDVMTVQPVEVHKAWVWFLPVHPDPEQVDEIRMPELPPWTSIVPMPGTMFRK